MPNQKVLSRLGILEELREQEIWTSDQAVLYYTKILESTLKACKDAVLTDEQMGTFWRSLKSSMYEFKDCDLPQRLH